MPQRMIDKIRESIRNGNYDMTEHAIEEMAEDELGIFEVEEAILKGEVIEIEKDDPGGNKYVVRGRGFSRFTEIGVVGRFKETGIFLIITVYKII